MRVLIYGGRDFEAGPEAWRWLGEHIFNYQLADWEMDEIVVISGGARGADRFGENAAEHWNIELEIYPADWGTHGKAAGYIRNQQMLDSGVDVAVQFPGGRGTADMRRRLDKAGVKVYEFTNDVGKEGRSP